MVKIVKYNTEMKETEAAEHIYQQLRSIIELYDLDAGLSLYLELNSNITHEIYGTDFKFPIVI